MYGLFYAILQNVCNIMQTCMEHMEHICYIFIFYSSKTDKHNGIIPIA